MKISSKNHNNSRLPILLIDVLVFLLLGLVIGFLDICMLNRKDFGAFSTNSLLLVIGITTGVATLVGFIFYLFVEYKYNRLKLKNVFFYLGVAIAITNLIAVITLPSQMSLPNDTTLTVTPTMRVYYIFSGLFYAMMPCLCFYLIPRKVTSRHYLDVFLYIITSFAGIIILLSFVTDWQHYINIFKSGFSDVLNNPIGSIFFDKGSFAMVMMSGIFASIMLRIRHNNWKWVLLLIPFGIFLVLSGSKIDILAGLLVILIYLIIRLVLLCKKNKNNLIITLLIVGFCLLVSSFFVVGIVRSESGLLFELKGLFLKLFDNSSTTMSSRLLIWESSFKLLSSWRVIFGYGVTSFDLVLHQVYTVVAPSFDLTIYSAHNFIIELLGNGGIVLLGIYLFIYGYFISITFKLRRKLHWQSIATFVFLAMFTLTGMFSQNSLCGVFIDAIPSLVIVLPIMSEYYISLDKEEKELRKDIVNSINMIKKSNPKSKILKLNKKRLIYEAKYIAYDLNSKIKL